MPPPPKTRQWCEEMRGLLGLPARTGGEAAPGSADGARARYGQGHKAFDLRGLPAPLKAAVEAGKLPSAEAWEASSMAPGEAERKVLLARRGELASGLAPLPTLRQDNDALYEKRKAIEAVLDRHKSFGERDAKLKGGTAFEGIERPALPCWRFDDEYQVADRKYGDMLSLKWALEGIKGPGPHVDALAAVTRWSDYWWSVKEAYARAKAQQADTLRDPADRIAMPAPLPDLSDICRPHDRAAAAWRQVAGRTGRASPLQAHTPPGAFVLAEEFPALLAQARAKLPALGEVAADLQNLYPRDPAQESTLEAVLEWQAYWKALAEGLARAQETSRAGFDPDTIPRPTTVPDARVLSGGGPGVAAVLAKISGTGPGSPTTALSGTVARGDFVGQALAAGANARAMNGVAIAMKDIEAPTPRQREIGALAEEWRRYWQDVARALAAAKDDAFDLAGIAAPPAMPTELQAYLERVATGGRALPLAAPTVPSRPPEPKKLPRKDFAGECEAATDKWFAMTVARDLVTSLAPPVDPALKSATLELVGEWEAYWWKVKKALEAAQADGNRQEFDCSLFQAPARQPDLSALLRPLDEARAEADAAYQASTELLEAAEKRLGECLPIVDAPRNNPERRLVAASLRRMKDIDGRIEKAGGRLDETLAADKTRALADLERELFAWNDRRTREDLPPSAEAVALGDVLQAEHRELIRQVVERKLPLTVADGGPADAEGRQALQKTWAQLRDGTGPLVVTTSHSDPPKERLGNRTPEEAEQFRTETLANLARLLGSPMGRDLVGKLDAAMTKSGRRITFEAYHEACCGADNNRDARTPDGVTKGPGTGSTVYMVRGAVDSDKAMCTESGAPLYAPNFISMGHEMVHALHHARGTSRDERPLTVDARWNDMEEFQTIRKGKTSEQTLRAQYGLSAQRFGHKRTEPGETVVNSLLAALDNAKQLDDLSAEELAARLRARGFPDPGALTDATTLAILAADPPVKGPLPDGWDANTLDIAQMRHVIEHRPAADLKRLGWSPRDLRAGTGEDSLAEVLRTRRPHPRSPEGVRYRTLGGDDALGAIADFHRKTGLEIATWTSADWPSRPAALQQALAWVARDGVALGGRPAEIAAMPLKLARKLPDLAAAILEARSAQKATGKAAPRAEQPASGENGSKAGATPDRKTANTTGE